MPDLVANADILIVDDTVENLRLLGSMLTEQGYNVRPVPNGRLALLAVAELAPDLILLDINMPDMNGYEVCEQLKNSAHSAEIPVIFISALSDTLDKIKAFDVGGVDYVTKPFQFKEVQARVKAHLSLSRLRRQIKEKNEQLEASLTRQRELEQLKERLVQMIVHDLKNPLTAIIGNTDYALDEVPANTAASEALIDLAGSAQSMHRMVLSILDVLQLEERRIQPRRTRVDLAELVDSSLGTFGSAAKSNGHEFKVTLQDDMPPVALDPDLIQRVIENLVENALKYAPSSTFVEVSVELTGGGDIAIDVRDLGQGIPVENRDQVFELYSRLERDQEIEAMRSRGLGLAFCKLAVEAHGGRIWIDDNEPQGAAFKIRIPASPATSASA